MAHSPPPRVFISYVHESPEHSARVLALADRLRSDGIDACIDQFEPVPPQGWPAWMEQKLEWSNYVLVVCTAQYRGYFEGKIQTGGGRGVGWEAAFIKQSLIDARMWNAKFLPVTFVRDDVEHIPTALKSYTYHVLYERYDDLYRHLTGQQKNKPRPLGPIRTMGPEGPKGDVLDAPVRGVPAVPIPPARPAPLLPFEGLPDVEQRAIARQLQQLRERRFTALGSSVASRPAPHRASPLRQAVHRFCGRVVQVKLDITAGNATQVKAGLEAALGHLNDPPGLYSTYATRLRPAVAGLAQGLNGVAHTPAIAAILTQAFTAFATEVGDDALFREVSL